MKSSDILLGVAAFGAAGLLFLFARRGTAAEAAPATGQASLFAQAERQTAITQEAVSRGWQELQDQVFKVEPNFWI